MLWQAVGTAWLWIRLWIGILAIRCLVRRGRGFGFNGRVIKFLSSEEEMSKNRPLPAPDTTSISAPEGTGCPRCKGAVFAAEQQLARASMWHKKCYNCCQCHRPLDSTLQCDGPDKEIYCKACYGKKYGPKGFGFGHAPTLVSIDAMSAPM